MSIAEKLTAIAENQEKVFEAGFISHTERHMQNCEKIGGFVNAFSGWGWTDETYNPVRPIKHSGTYNNMFAYSRITDTKVDIDVSLSALNRSNVFNYSTKLKTIRKIITTENNKYTAWFTGCTALENITFEGTIGNSINFSDCPLSVESMVNIISHLYGFAEDEEGYLTYTVTFNDECWEALETSGKTPWTELGWGDEESTDTWKIFVECLGWLT